MAVTSKVLFRGAASTSSTTLYTTPSATTAIVTNIVVANTSSSLSGTFTLTLDSVEIAKDVVVATNDSVTIDLKQVLPTTKIIAGFASATTMKFHISGVEIA